MHIIAKTAFSEAKKQYPVCATALDDTYNALKKSKAKTPEELKLEFKSLDNFKHVDKWYVIDIGGNTLRLIAFIEFKGGKLFVKHIVSHAEYDKINKKYRIAKGK